MNIIIYPKSTDQFRWATCSLVKVTLLFMACFSLGLAGCKKKEVAVNPPSAPAAQPQAGLPVDPTGLPNSTPAVPVAITPDPNADINATLAMLTKELRRSLPSGHPPKDFTALVASRNLQVPPPPKGKKYVINKQWRVELVDN